MEVCNIDAISSVKDVVCHRSLCRELSSSAMFHEHNRHKTGEPSQGDFLIAYELGNQLVAI